MKLVNNLNVLIAILITTLTIGSASAAWIPLTNDPVSLESLIGTSLIVGDKEFSEFDMFAYATGGAIAPNSDSVFVQGGMDDSTGDYGLRFLLSASAGSEQIINATLQFKVAVLPGPRYENNFIKDISYYFTGASATDTGLVTSAETIWDGAFPDGEIIASLSLSKQQNDGGNSLIDSAEFAPVKAIWIQSKDISITGGTSPAGSAHLSEFYQFYSQVPEPATIGLLIAGVFLFNNKTKRKK